MPEPYTPAPILPALNDTDYKALRDHIAANGLQVPILVTPSGTIIDGHERYKALNELGIKRYPVRVVKVTDKQRQSMAISLNVHRRHLTSAQKRELIEKMLRLDPSKSDRSVAKTVGATHPTVATVRGKIFHPASIGVETRRGVEEASNVLDRIDGVGGNLTMRDAKKVAWKQTAEKVSSSPTAALPANIQIHHCGFMDLEVKAGSVDLVLTDPPWSAKEGFHSDLASKVFGWLRPGGVLACYTGTFALPMFLDAFRSAGLTYQWLMVGTYAKEETAGIDAAKSSLRIGGRFASSIRPIIIFTKGKFGDTRGTVHDLMFSKSDGQRHPKNWQQPISESRYLISRFTMPGALSVDCFVGSGTAAIACQREGEGRRFIGCDVDQTCVRIARKAVAEAMAS